MARQTNIETTTFYRALVTTSIGLQEAFGPYSAPGYCVDQDKSWRSGPTTVEVQELRPPASRSAEGVTRTDLEWVTIKTRGA